MMLLGWLGLFGALVSAACIALLAAVDPKRRGVRAFSSEVGTGSREENASKQKDGAPFRFNRNGKSASPARPGLRRLLWLAIFLPGLALGIAGRWSDFLIWIGAAAIFGWAIAALANTRSKARP
jgi:hypothetical protein